MKLKFHHVLLVIDMMEAALLKIVASHPWATHRFLVQLFAENFKLGVVCRRIGYVWLFDALCILCMYVQVCACACSNCNPIHRASGISNNKVAISDFLVTFLVQKPCMAQLLSTQIDTNGEKDLWCSSTVWILLYYQHA